MTDSPILKAALRWLVLILGCDRVPPAASAPMGKAPTSLIYHIQWYRAAAIPPQCLHALHQAWCATRSCSSLRYIALLSTPLRLGDSLHNISIEQPRRSIPVTCRGRLDLFANSAVLRPKKQSVHMESIRKQNPPPPSAGSVPGWPLQGPFSRSPEARKVAPWVQACLRSFTFLTCDMSSTETLSRRHAHAVYSGVLPQS